MNQDQQQLNAKSTNEAGNKVQSLDQVQMTGKNVENKCTQIQMNFSVTTDQLCEYVDGVQNRAFAEEVDQIEKDGGEDQLIQNLKTDKKKGIQNSEFDARVKAFGSNEKAKKKLKSLWEIFIESLNDFTLKILIVAAIVSIVVEVIVADDDKKNLAWIEGFAILMAVGISSGITTVNDYQKQKQFALLNEVSESRKMVTIIRNGENHYLHQSNLLVGDLCVVDNGMEIPADGYLIEANEITTDESAMTGETLPIKKDILEKCVLQRNQLIAEGSKDDAGAHDVPSPIMLSGSKVLSGEGKMLIVAVGKLSAIGKIQNLLGNEEDKPTPLQLKLEIIAEDIGKFGLISAIFILCVLLIRWVVDESAKGDSGFGKQAGTDVIHYVIIAITVIVVAIPEGLPLAVTLSLAFSVKKMLYDQNLVRQMSACETMGGANCICSDKTGTLTQNKMNLQQMWNQKLIPIDTYAEKLNLADYVPAQYQNDFSQSVIINSSANLFPEESGMATEIALLKFINRCSQDITAIRNKFEVVTKMPFSSSRKRMSTVVKIGDKQMIYVKGASEIVLESCSKMQGFDGQTIDLNGEAKQTVYKAIEAMANQALRTIIIAQKEVGSENLNDKDDKGVFKVEQSGLTMVALLGIKDILRQEVPGAIAQCKAAGVRVRMVTGDNLMTARAIAIECGIINPENKDSLVMNGSDFIEKVGGVICKNCQTKICDCPLDEVQAQEQKKKVRVDTIANGQAFDDIIGRLDVMSRSRPEDKYAMVVGLIERGSVVAVTGDGTNDAPALKKADVGFAMGIAGTQVAREACDIILLDDNFNSIVKAIMWGRNIYDCIKKFLQFQLTVNVVAVAITLIGSAILKMPILTAIQMLWVNLIMDTLASLALATEPPTMELLNRAPHSRTDYILSKKMMKHIGGQAIFQLIILIILVFDGENLIPEYKDDLDTFLVDNYPNTFKDSAKASGTTQYSLWLKYQYNTDKMITGRLYSIDGKTPQYTKATIQSVSPSRQFTFIFNTFVMMQIFNFINARKLKDERNIFEGITKSSVFILIVVLIFILQAIILTFGGLALNCYKYGGLHIYQWLISIGIGSISLFVNQLIKFVDEEKLFFFMKNKPSQEEQPASQSRILSLRKGSLKEQSKNN